MTARPFLTVRIRGQKDAIRVRHRARQIASLLHFPIHEQACAAAATFVIACQVLRLPGRHAIRFTIDNEHLHVDAQAVGDGAPVNRVAPLIEQPAEAPLRLVKRLPADRPLAEPDLAWLVKRTEEVPAGLFEEIIRQNQEVLTLLHELHAIHQHPEAGETARPHAA